MALIDQFTESAQPVPFTQRVQMAASNAAISVIGEAATSLNSADAAAAATTITPVATTGFASGDLVAIGVGLATVETRKITVSGANFTVSATTNAHKAGEIIQKVIFNHANRIALAKAILNSPAGYAALFANAICANDATLTFQNDATITDTQINNNVAAVFNAVAGTV